MAVYVLLAMGIGLLLAAIIIFGIRYRIYKTGTRVVGKIIEIKKTDEAILDDFHQLSFITLYRPVIEFTTEEGEKIVFVHNEPGSSRDFDVNDDIMIVYNKKKSNDFYVDDKMEFFRLSITLVILALLFFSFSFTLYLI